MADFESRIHKLRIEEHPNADRLELAAIGGYRCVVLKGQYKDGDLAAYIPEGSVCPDWLIAELGLEGRLSGPKENRVKAVRLRGALSQGLVYPVTGERLRTHHYSVGDDVTNTLELVKYEPPIPIHMQGDVTSAFGFTLKYDIEDVKKFPHVLRPGEQVVMTEKLHGTWCCLGWHPDFGPVVSSKGLSSQGLVFKLDGVNEKNLYVMAWKAHQAKLRKLFSFNGTNAGPCYVLGEIHGPGIQNLQYGLPKPEFRIFDIYVGEPGPGGSYFDPYDMQMCALEAGLLAVPAIWRGPFSEEVMLEHTDGLTTLGAHHIREGVVIRPVNERRDPEMGRVILKSVSGDYLTRRRKKPRKESK